MSSRNTGYSVRVNPKVSTTAAASNKQGDVELANFGRVGSNNLVIDVLICCDHIGNSSQQQTPQRQDAPVLTRTLLVRPSLMTLPHACNSPCTVQLRRRVVNLASPFHRLSEPQCSVAALLSNTSVCARGEAQAVALSARRARLWRCAHRSAHIMC